MKQAVVFIADSLDNAYKYQRILLDLEVDVSAGSTMQLKKLLAPEHEVNLVIFEARGHALSALGEVTSLAGDLQSQILLIIDEEDVLKLDLPDVGKGDFIFHGASDEECITRIRRLLSQNEGASNSETIVIDNMVINLATYQVTVADEPVDFTYLEYALLSFLVRHPGHTYSRDALLQHVWGFDYYGGSRTVDVHVRRIRSKLGTDLAQRLETVRGVGYLWAV